MYVLESATKLEQYIFFETIEVHRKVDIRHNRFVFPMKFKNRRHTKAKHKTSIIRVSEHKTTIQLLWFPDACAWPTLWTVPAEPRLWATIGRGPTQAPGCLGQQEASAHWTRKRESGRPVSGGCRPSSFRTPFHSHTNFFLGRTKAIPR